MSSAPEPTDESSARRLPVPRFFLEILLVAGGVLFSVIFFGVLNLYWQARERISQDREKIATYEARLSMGLADSAPQALVVSAGGKHPGKSHYLACGACHGQSGEGNAQLKAPSLRQLDSWYIERQVDNYRNKVRGGDPRDTLGSQMTGMVQGLSTKEAVSQVADYIASMREAKVAAPAPSLDGDVARGKQLYGTCVSCHGADAGGNKALNAPPLAGQYDWYLLTQMRNFKEGIRGSDPKDAAGAMMRPMAQALDDGQMRDLASYLATLALPGAGSLADGSGDQGGIDIAGLSPVAAGGKLFAANCSSCHQDDGFGRVGLAPSIRNRDFLALASDDFIKATIQEGRPGTTMAARKDLGEEELSAIVAWLRAMPTANPVQVTVDPHKVYNGDVAAGAGHYVRYCSSCHGPRGEGYSAGSSGPGIGLDGFLNVASDDFIMQTLKLGRAGTPMRSFVGANGLANLSEDDARDIVAYLRSLEVPRVPAPSAPVSQAPKTTLDPVHGKKLFSANCSSCHQDDGQGKPGMAPAIRNRDFLAIASDSFIRTAIREGRTGTAMVPRPDLSEDDVNDILAWLRANPPENPVSIHVDNTKRVHGDVGAGKAAYQQYCSSCHAPGGKGYSAGGVGPGIGLPGFLKAASDDYIIQTVRQGRVGTAMRAFIGAEGLASLQEDDVHDIITYLRHQQD